MTRRTSRRRSTRRTSRNLRRNDSRRLADLMRQGFMKPLKRRRAKKEEKPIVACEDCMNWHREGKHTSTPAVRKERRAARRASLKRNSTRYTTRTPVRPDIHVDEHSSEAEIIQAWRNGRLGIKTAERILIARPDVFRQLRTLAQNGISFQWRRTTNRAGMGSDRSRLATHSGFQEWRALSHVRSPGEDSREIQWEINISGSDAHLWDWDAEYDPAGVQKYRRKQGTSNTLRAAQAASEAWIRRTATRTAI